MEATDFCDSVDSYETQTYGGCVHLKSSAVCWLRSCVVLKNPQLGSPLVLLGACKRASNQEDSMMETTSLAEAVPLQKYRESRPHIFPSVGSMQWYFRTHKEGLAAAGALLMIRGVWFVQPDVFDRYVVEAGAREAAAA